MTHKETHGKNCICHSCAPAIKGSIGEHRVPLALWQRREIALAQPRGARR